MVGGDTDVHHTPFHRSGSEKKVVHPDPDCYHIQTGDNIRGPKPIKLIPDAEVCQSCSGQREFDGNDKRKVTRLLEISNPEDLGLSPLQERGT